MRRHLARACVAVLLASPMAPARAMIRHLAIEPSTVILAVRGYGVGLLAIDGHFTRFHGALTLDDQDPAVCELSLDAESSSLSLPSAWMTGIALGPEVLDVAHFPDFTITGHCEAGRLQATLRLHGVTKPLLLNVTSKPGAWQAAGPMRRAEWGMGARPLLAGPEVTISITAGLPADFKTRS